MSQTFLIPTDFSAASEIGVRAGVELAQQLGASVVLMHVWDTKSVGVPPITIGWSAVKQDRLIEEIRAGLTAKLAAVAKALPEGLVQRAELVEDVSAARAITAYADEQDIDLIVVCTHGRTGLEHFLVGSVAEKIVRFAKCRVLTVPAGGVKD